MRAPVFVALMLSLTLGMAGTGTAQAGQTSTVSQASNPYSDQTIGQKATAPAFKREDVEKVIKEIVDRYDKLMAELRKKLAALGKTKTKSKAPGSYTVVSGDSLSKIAGKFLGNPDRYWEIVELNKSKYPSLVNNPNLIYPGWVLMIPGTSSGSTTPTNPSTSGSSTDSAALNGWKGGKLSPSEFSRLLGPAAKESMKRTGVPASVTLAQAALETGWGKATIGDAKNLFGIKGTGPAGSITVSTQEYMNGHYVTIRDSFRKYNTWSESIDDHAKLLTQNSRYSNCMKNKNNPDQFARELQKAGYATSPTYASTLISIMKSNNLYQWDK